MANPRLIMEALLALLERKKGAQEVPMNLPESPRTLPGNRANTEHPDFDPGDFEGADELVRRHQDAAIARRSALEEDFPEGTAPSTAVEYFGEYTPGTSGGYGPEFLGGHVTNPIGRQRWRSAPDDDFVNQKITERVAAAKGEEGSTEEIIRQVLQELGIK